LQFREKIEIATSPLIAELRLRLVTIPTVTLLNHYQLKHHLSQFDKEKLPDGFWAKWRYLWALKLSTPFLERVTEAENEREFSRIDELIEQIFDLPAERCERYVFWRGSEPNARLPANSRSFPFGCAQGQDDKLR